MYFTIFCALAVISFSITWRAMCTKRYPPGPGSIPILGSVHLLPLEYQERTFYEWGKRYGDVIYLKLFRRPTVVLNTLRAARDLLDKRSAKYSDRPRLVMLAELLGHDTSTPALPYGDRFRRHRKWMHEHLSTTKALDAYKPIQKREVTILLQNLLETPDAFFAHTYRYVAAVLLEITYGIRTFSMDDELVQLAERSVDATNESGNPGAMLVDFFPILKHIPTWLPGAEFKRRAFRGRMWLEAWRKRGIEVVQDAMAEGKAPSSITLRLLEANKNHESEVLEDIIGVGVSVYGAFAYTAGTETTHGTLMSFVLAMARNPEVLHKAQEEIDRVVGRDRFPDFSDRESLPYVNALLEELFRWNPGLPLAIPHRLMSHDRYRDYDIPAGCMIMPNIWGMTRDTTYFPNPEEFRPERHLPTEGTAADEKQIPSTFIFGFGRRTCPGQAFADASLWLAITDIIAAFDIRAPVDSEGNESKPPAEFQPGFTSRPKPFQCRIFPRSEGCAAAIMHLEV